MKIAIPKLIVLLLLVSFSCSTAYRPYTQRSATGTTQLFYDELSPYGDWVHNREYGYVWIPHTGGNFYPYATNGRWVLTDYGWTWLSDYQWGWAAFHYGRWDFDPQYGWFWFPGDEWAPAWVTWRQGDGYFGWAPMPPASSMGYGYKPDEIYRYIFVRDRDFGKSNISRYYINRRRNDDIIRNTRVISERIDQGRRTLFQGPDPSLIENSTGRRIRRLTVTDSSIPGRRLSKNQLELYRPQVVTASGGQRPAPSRITDVKDIRPVRERNRNYQPETTETNEAVGNYGGQGGRVVRNADEERRRQSAEKEYMQNRSERLQRSEQQKRTMQKERQSREVNDTSVTRRSVQTRSVRQKRR